MIKRSSFSAYYCGVRTRPGKCIILILSTAHLPNYEEIPKVRPDLPQWSRLLTTNITLHPSVSQCPADLSFSLPPVLVQPLLYINKIRLGCTFWCPVVVLYLRLCFPWKCFIAYFTLPVSLTSFTSTVTHCSSRTEFWDQTSK